VVVPIAELYTIIVVGLTIGYVYSYMPICRQVIASVSCRGQRTSTESSRPPGVREVRLGASTVMSCLSSACNNLVWDSIQGYGYKVRGAVELGWRDSLTLGAA